MKLFWKLYSILFFAIVWKNALQLLDKNSLFGTYYGVMMVFNSWYAMPYFLNIFNSMINCVVCIFIFGYAFNLQGINLTPGWLFYIRLLSDLTGHSFEVKIIESDFSQGNLTGFLGLTQMVVPILPSYLALWLITFRNKTKAP